MEHRSCEISAFNIQDSLINYKDGHHATKAIAAEHVSLLFLALSVTKSIVEQKAHQ